MKVSLLWATRVKISVIYIFFYTYVNMYTNKIFINQLEHFNLTGSQIIPNLLFWKSLVFRHQVDI